MKITPLLRTALLSALASMLVTWSPRPELPPTDVVTKFYEKLLQIVEQNAVNRWKIDWLAYKAVVLTKVGAARTVPETEPAMLLALALLKDNHSTINMDGKESLYGGIGCQRSPLPGFPVSLPDIRYFEVTGFSGTDLEDKSFAQAIRNYITRLDNPSLKEWIVDLRRNTGGNMWPMGAGLGPLIGEGVCGEFYDIDGKLFTTYSYKDESSLLDGRVQAQVNKAHHLQRPNPKQPS